MTEYHKDIKRYYKTLNKETQRTLCRRMQEGDKDARNTLITSCLPLVIDLAKKFALNNKHIDVVDFVQEGNVALIKAVDRFDPDKDNSITTVATTYIRHTFIDMLTNSKYHIQNSFKFTREAIKQLNQIKKIDSTDPKEISQQTGISQSRIRKLMTFLPGTRYSASNRKNAKVLYALSSNEEEYTPRACVQDLIDLAKQVLTDTETKLIFSYYGVRQQRKTLKQLATQCNDSVQNVDKTITLARKKLKAAAAEEV